MSIHVEAPATSETLGTGQACGTFGELLQGALADPQVDFLVTLPIEAGSTARFRYDRRTTDIRVVPGDRKKARSLARSMLTIRGFSGGGELHVDTELPIGKGLASSSADLVATAWAVGRALGELPTPGEIEELMRRIEPSDGVMYPGTVAFRHRDVRLLERLGYLPDMTIVGVDEGGSVDTVAFNRGHRRFSDSARQEYQRLLDSLRVAVPAGDTAEIGHVASRSAAMHQRLHPKRMLRDVLGICGVVGGLGVVTAHSGTMLGILLDEADPDYTAKLGKAIGECTALAGGSHLFRTARPARRPT
ncbi:GHMP family kinase ATP-binding protein [Nonomuraea endophytica]|uniref:L-threonine kinase n=1 Tax=Nonomuraea endophytica TaxID=714136 RepID=A0A7W8AEW6_9ACTN|nr:kinase [Nonomuraea endophytica]MBB5084855.1 L-threonine kinase [Nonomuraea endophytica]